MASAFHPDFGLPAHNVEFSIISQGWPLAKITIHEQENISRNFMLDQHNHMFPSCPFYIE